MAKHLFTCDRCKILFGWPEDSILTNMCHQCYIKFTADPVYDLFMIYYNEHNHEMATKVMYMWTDGDFD